MPTADALVERVGTIAQSLQRLEGDVTPDMLEKLDARLAEARGVGAIPADRERRVQLLERQRTSVVDLLEHRATLTAQLESASLALQNVKLELLKLRSGGLGAAMNDVTTATQEARALSRDIKYALEAAAEVRGN
jgi:serine/threonine-protein kinase